ncbi:hemolysin regulation protein AhpA [Pasteurellaceae bacterium Macca]|nr:hemolysin regulation protein AhpA [Pasteurellaceae bacterium Macca]
MYITREKALKSSLFALIMLICVAIVGLILDGVNQFKVGSQLASLNQVSNLSHLLVRQQARLFSILLLKNTQSEELVEALDTFAKEDFVIDANLYSASGHLLAQSHNAQPLSRHSATQKSSTQQIVEPIVTPDGLIGFLRITFDMQYGQTTQSKVNSLFHLLYGELVILFLAGGLAVSCFYGMRHPTVVVNRGGNTEIAPQKKTQTARFHSRRRAFRRK